MVNKSTRDKLNIDIGILDKLIENTSSSSPPPFNAEKFVHEVRGQIALFFTKGFFYLVGITLIGIPTYNIFVEGDKILNLKDILLAMSGILGTSFGFIMGYYFKSSDGK